MGTAERKEREKERRRLDIIDAAEDVFFSKGFENATMDDVAKQAELGKGTLYLYFESKEDIYAEICKRGTRILHNLFLKAIENEPNGLCKVKRIGEAFIKFYREYQNYYQVFLYMDNKEIHVHDINVLPNKHNHKDEGFDLFISVIKEGINDGSIRNDIDPQKTAILLWAETAGVLQLMKNKGKAIIQGYGLTEAEVIDTFFEFTFNALKK